MRTVTSPLGEPGFGLRRWLLLALGAVVVVGAGLFALQDRRPPVSAAATPLCSAGRSPAGSVTVLPVSHWENRYLQTWDFERTEALPASRSADSWEHYTLSYAVDANTAVFRATGRTRYLDRALEYLNGVVDTARASKSLPTSQYRDGYLGWVSNRKDLQPTGVEVSLYESYFWRHATTTLRIMRQTPAVYDDLGYRARYEKLLAFAETHVFDKWHSRGANDTIYRSRTHMASHWATIALNLAAITEDPARRDRYRKVVDDIDRKLPNYPTGLRGQLQPHPVDASAYFWNDEWGSTRRPGQDVSHANGVMSYVVEAEGQGDFWTAADMTRFGNLLTKVIWPGERRYAAFVDGSGNDNGWFSDGLVKLGRYDPAVQQRLERHEVVNGQFAANMALNAMLLQQAPSAESSSCPP
ncbi:hypothetical protein [Actinoplanes flavus]|uniref:Uncharacterized protein n=1 Tax=Actinoplanes flavus TaxID=2820290 RepID=A0ABS3UIX0_9ACTN|nr:hypothetical protein [Actinoplanes flavus]MBO3737688.1 hypothetical protein [Actinoplanes flavus]